MIPVETARRLILERMTALPAATIPLLTALGRVLAEPIDSPISLPPFDNSAMDGYALRSADVADASLDRPCWLAIAAEMAAGTTRQPTLLAGQACRIMTGSPLPAGADAVLKVEETQELDGKVAIPRPVPPGENLRRAGEDLVAGMRILEAGTPLNAARLALLAGVGRATVAVHGVARVAILTTGDELLEPGEDLLPGHIYNSNAYALAALVAEAGAVPFRLGVAPDDREATRRSLSEALEYDVVLTTGGVSMGVYDFVGETLAELGTVHFDRVAQQPGKPFTFATVKGKPVFGLPGNPVSAMVSFEYYVRPALRKLMGHLRLDRPRVEVVMDEGFQKRPGRQLFLRGQVERSAEGFRARLSGLQGSAMLGSMAAANALILVPAELGPVRAGDRLEALLLDETALETAPLPLALSR